MGGFDFDRQPFTRPAGAEQKPQRPSAVPGFLIVLVLLAVAGFAAYRLLNLGGDPQVSENNAALQQINKRLDALEHRMDQTERRRRAFLARPLIPAVEDEPAYTVSPPPVRHSISTSGFSPRQDSSPVHSMQGASKSIAVSQAKPLPGNSAGNKGDSSRAVGTSSSQQEWEATANRLGDIVGELATQRNEIDQTQASLGQLSERLGRESTPFVLQRDARPQRVGPVRLRLEKTDVKNQRYTMRLFMGDQSVELENRAVHEAIQFYSPESGGAFDLVVSEIRKDGVNGRLTLPAGASAR